MLLEKSLSLNEVMYLGKECKWFQVCPMKSFWKEGMLDRKWVEQYCKGNWNQCKRYKMVEEGDLCPDSMLPNGKTDKRLEE